MAIATAITATINAIPCGRRIGLRSGPRRRSRSDGSCVTYRIVGRLDPTLRYVRLHNWLQGKGSLVAGKTGDTRVLLRERGPCFVEDRFMG